MFEEMKIRYLLLFSFIGTFVTILVLLALNTSDVTLDVVSQLVMYVAIPALYFGYYFRKHHVSVWDVLHVHGVKKWLPPLVALVGVSIAFSLSMFWFQLYVLAPVAPWLVDVMLTDTPIPQTPAYIAFTIFSIAILAPVVEEFMFRGVLLKRLIGKTSTWGGIVLSSLFFGLLHLEVVGAFLFGVVASLLYLRTRNLLVPILLHILNNSLAVTSMFLAPTWPASIGIFEWADIYAKATPNAVLLVISGMLLIGGIVWLARGLPPEKQSLPE